MLMIEMIRGLVTSRTNYPSQSDLWSGGEGERCIISHPYAVTPQDRLWTLKPRGVPAWWAHLVPGGGVATLILQGEDREALPLASNCLFIWLVLIWILSERTVITSRVIP